MTRTRIRTRALSPHNRPVPAVVIPTKRPLQKPSGQPKPKKPPICKVVVPKLPSMSKDPTNSQSCPKDPSAGPSHAESEPYTPSIRPINGKPVELPLAFKTRPQRDPLSDDNLDEESAPVRHPPEQDTRSESAHREPFRPHVVPMEPPLGSQRSESTLEYIDRLPSSSPAPDVSQFQLHSLAHRSSECGTYEQPAHLDPSNPAVSRSSSRDSAHTVQAPHHAQEDVSDHDDHYSIPLGRDGLPISSQRRPPASSDGSDPFGFSKAERVLQEYRAKGHVIQLTAQAPNDSRQPPRKAVVQAGGSGRKLAEGNDAQPESDLSLTDLLPIPKTRRSGKSRSQKKSDVPSKRTRKRYHRETKDDQLGSSGDENTEWANQAVARDPSEHLERNSSLSPTRSPRPGRALHASSSGRPGKFDPVRNKAQGTSKPFVLKRIDPNRKINKNTGILASKSSDSNLKRKTNDTQDPEQNIVISTPTVTPPERKKRLEYYKELEKMEFEEEVVI